MENEKTLNLVKKTKNFKHPLRSAWPPSPRPRRPCPRTPGLLLQRRSSIILTSSSSKPLPLPPPPRSSRRRRRRRRQRFPSSSTLRSRASARRRRQLVLDGEHDRLRDRALPVVEEEGITGGCKRTPLGETFIPVATAPRGAALTRPVKRKQYKKKGHCPRKGSRPHRKTGTRGAERNAGQQKSRARSQQTVHKDMSQRRPANTHGPRAPQKNEEAWEHRAVACPLP